jgi:glycosyltransferase involved in cell wall biosynthesis
MTRPTLTIGVPVYNGERYLPHALENLLAQSFQDYEIVVADNGSRDRTPEICRSYAMQNSRIRYLRYERTVSPVASFRRTVARASGRYFTWTAVDDVRPPGAIEACVEALEKSPDAVMAHGPVIADCVRLGTRVVVEHRMDLTGGEAGSRIRTFTREMRYNGMLYGIYRLDLLRRAVFLQHPGHDYLLPLQMCLLGPLAYTPVPMLIYQHVWGETDTPMYKVQPITVRDLLLYRGVRRHKCWVTLALGAAYLLRLRGVPRRDRLVGVVTHIGAFARRFRRHLMTELAFLAFTPAAWAASPFAPFGRRLKRALAVRGFAG